MNKSDAINELAAALAKAQGQIKGAKKDSANPFFKSKYADLASVVEAIQKPLSDNGIAYVQVTIPCESEAVQVETMLMHSSGQWVSGVISVPVAKNDAQGYGSALTYARRYGLSAAAGVAPEDDDGNAAAKAAPITPNAGAGESLTAKQKQRVMDVAVVVKDKLGSGKDWDAYSDVELANFDTDEKLFLWAQLNSKERASLKRAADAERNAAKTEA